MNNSRSTLSAAWSRCGNPASTASGWLSTRLKVCKRRRPHKAQIGPACSFEAFGNTQLDYHGYIGLTRYYAILRLTGSLVPNAVTHMPLCERKSTGTAHSSTQGSFLILKGRKVCDILVRRPVQFLKCRACPVFRGQPKSERKGLRQQAADAEHRCARQAIPKFKAEMLNLSRVLLVVFKSRLNSKQLHWFFEAFHMVESNRVNDATTGPFLKRARHQRGNS